MKSEVILLAVVIRHKEGGSSPSSIRCTEGNKYAHIRPKKDPDLAGQGWGGNRPPFATYLYLGLADLGTGLGLGPVGLATFTSPLWGGGKGR